MAAFQLESLGTLRLIGPGGELLPGRRRELVLLVYLARQGSSVARQELAELLWPDRDEKRARQSLRQTLYRLRSELGSVVHVDPEHASLDPLACSLDVTTFQDAIADGRYADAVAQWQGEFLADLEGLGGEAFRAWLEAEREALRRQLAWTLERLVEQAEQRRERDEVIRWARQWAAILPTEEGPHLRLVKAFLAARRPSDALVEHAGFVARLRDHDLQPSAALLELGTELAHAPAGDPNPGSTALLAPDLVARDAQLAELERAWRDTRERGVVVLVEGEEGIGRTRMAREFLRRAQARGALLILDAQATERDCGTAQATARRLFAGIRHAPGLLGAPDEALAELTAIAPTLRERFPELPHPIGTEEALADATARVLEDVAAEVPVIVHIDDLGRADAATLRLIAAIAHRVPAGVLLLLTVCSDAPEATSDYLHEVADLRRLKLQPLSAPEVAVMLDSMLALDTTDRLVLAERLHSETGGNPLYTSELVAVMADAGLLTPGEGGSWRIATALDARALPTPTGLRATVLARIQHLSADARELLDAAAVLGSDVDPQLLHAVGGLPDAAFATALDELFTRRILRPPQAADASCSFAQELTRRVAHDALPPERRRQLHRRALRAGASHGADDEHMRVHRRHAHLILPRLRILVWRHPRPAAAALVLIFAAAIAVAATATGRRTPASPGAVAVFPFEVEGDADPAHTGRAIATLLAVSIDGAPGLRSVDPLRLRDSDAPAVLRPERAQDLAGRVGAAHYIVGTVIESRGRLQATASLYGPESLRATAMVRAESDAGLFELVDALARELLSDLQPGTRGERARVAASTTTSLPAFKEYLNGETALHEGRYDEAITAFQQALDRDSMFALASYRIAVAAEWRADLPTLKDALARALRHRDRLPARYRLLAAADSARHVGAADDAERRYRDVLSRYPDEALAWYYLGEVLIHSNPLRGRPMAESRRAFEQTLARDSGNYEARWHLAQLAVSERDTTALAQWLDPLLAGSEIDRIVWRTLQDALFRDTAAMRRNEQTLQRSAADVAYAGAWFVPLLVGDFEEGIRLAGSLLTPERAPEWRAGGHVLMAHAELARGRRAAALAALVEAERLDPATGRTYRVLFSLLPTAPLSHSALTSLRDELRVWNADDVAPTNVPHPFVALHDGAHSHLRVYLLGLIEALLGDTLQARRHAAELRRLGGAPHAAAFGPDLALGVEAEAARMQGQPARALALLEAMELRAGNTAATFSPFYSHVRERFVRALLLQEMGRHADAERWFASIAESPPFGYALLGPTLLQRAALHAGRAEHDSADALFRRVGDLWRDADAPFISMIEQTRTRATRGGRTPPAAEADNAQWQRVPPHAGDALMASESDARHRARSLRAQVRMRQPPRR